MYLYIYIYVSIYIYIQTIINIVKFGKQIILKFA